jgi:hypothetical protein
MALHISALWGHLQRLNSKRRYLKTFSPAHTLTLHGPNRTAIHLTNNNKRYESEDTIEDTKTSCR